MKTRGQTESQKQERRIAEKYQGQVSAASGAGWSRKGDVRAEDLLIEAKWTEKKSFSLTKDVLDKIENEALMESREWALYLTMQGRDYVTIDADVFEMYYRAWKERETTQQTN